MARGFMLGERAGYGFFEPDELEAAGAERAGSLCAGEGAGAERVVSPCGGEKCDGAGCEGACRVDSPPARVGVPEDRPLSLVARLPPCHCEWVSEPRGAL
jgi:hypothetical protein